MKRLLSLSASAGSGKTFNLAARYLSLLFRGAKPNDILAVTFTNKSANEMKERVIKYLRNFENEDTIRQIVSENTGIDERILIDMKKKILKNFLVNDIHISTIDAFINKILRKFSFYLNIESDFEIGSEDEEVVLKEFLNDLSDKEFEDLVLFSKREKKMHSSMEEVFKLLYEKDKELPKLSLKKYPLDKEKAQKSFFRLKEFILESNASNRGKNAINIEFDEIPTTTWFAKNSLNEYSYFKKVYQDWFDDVLRELKEYFRIEFLNREADFLDRLFRLYEKYKNRKFYYKRENNLLDFKDIEILVYELLREDNFVSDIKEFIYFRLDSKIEHILIDEFQDTSITQWQIFEPLVDEIASGEGVEPFKSFFYVGDTKQSIYRFRGGQKRLFDYVYNYYKQFGMQKQNLDTNYRSKENIVEFVNDTFKLTPRQKSAKKGGYVEVIESDEVLNDLKASLSFLFDNGVKDEDIAILVWKNSDIIQIAEFIKETFDKESFTSTRAKVINQPFTQAVINLMKYSYDKRNELNKLNFLSLVSKKFTSEDIIVPIMKPSKMIKYIIDKYELIDESTLRLLEYSFKYKTLVDFVYDIDNFDEELPQQELKGIQILTVHKSKGLEFENVIVLDVLGKNRNPHNELLFDYEGVELRDIKKYFKGREIVDNEYQKVLEKEKLLEYEDSKNAEYVAFTRPKNSLFIIKKSKSSKFVTNLTPQTIGEFENDIEKPQKTPTIKFDLDLKNYGKQDYKDKEEKEYKPNDFDAIYFGLAVHYAFECENLDAVQNKYGEFCNVEEAFKVFQEGKNKIIKMMQNKNIYKEYPFIYEEKEGIIDLLIEDEDEIVIIDYKTHTPDDKRGYIKQIQRYKTAMKNLKNKSVKGFIFYLDEMSLKEI